jgi:hypothetical protein
VIVKPANVATPDPSVDWVSVPPKVFEPGLDTTEAVTAIPAPAGVAPASVTVGEIENVAPDAWVVLAVLNVEVLTTNDADAEDAGLAASSAVYATTETEYVLPAVKLEMLQVVAGVVYPTIEDAQVLVVPPSELVAVAT